MPNPFLDPESFNPQLVDRVNAAYERNLRGGLAVDGAFAGEVSVQSLADMVKTDTADARSNGSAGLTGFDQLQNPDTRQAFETSFTATEQLFSRINLTTPTAEQCIDAGVDLEVLGAAYERMQAEGLEPAVVLAPSLDVTSWYILYKNLKEDQVINFNFRRLKHNGLYVNTQVVMQWDYLAILPSDVPAIFSPGNALRWSLRLIPGTPAPTQTFVSHSYNYAIHPTINEYLSLQATRLQARQELPDEKTTTWLNGECDDEYDVDAYTWAPFGRWTNEGVCISLNGIHKRSTTIGVRPPV